MINRRIVFLNALLRSYPLWILNAVTHTDTLEFTRSSKYNDAFVHVEHRFESIEPSAREHNKEYSFICVWKWNRAISFGFKHCAVLIFDPNWTLFLLLFFNISIIIIHFNRTQFNSFRSTSFSSSYCERDTYQSDPIFIGTLTTMMDEIIRKQMHENGCASLQNEEKQNLNKIRRNNKK